MRRRERLPEQLAETPPEQLRRFGDSWDDGKGLGRDVFGGREEWIAARRAWEAEHRVALDEWFRLLCEDQLARGGLVAMNTAFSLYFTEDEDYEDPRELAS